MRIIIIIGILLGLDSYLFDAVTTAFQGFDPIWMRVVGSIYWLIPLMAMVFGVGFAVNRFKNMSGVAASNIRAFFIIAYLSKLLGAAVWLLDDIRQLIMSLMGNGRAMAGEPSVLMAWLAIGAFLFPFLLLIYGMIRNRFRFQVFKEKIRLKNLPKSLEGLKILQISDIHSGSFTEKEPIRRAIDLINDQNADLVFFTGDLVNYTASEMEGYKDIFSQIKARYGVFSILGNHDYGDYVRWSDSQQKERNLSQLKSIHREMGWDLLLNENRLLPINGEEIAIIGVENFSASPRFSKYGDLEKAYQGTEKASLKLLLSHDPSHWEYQVIKKFKDIAITFSGHTHGMQFGIELGKFFRWSPAKYAYKQWAGLYKKGKQFLYVNRGFGFHGYPGRVGILPEITVVELASKDGNV